MIERARVFAVQQSESELLQCVPVYLSHMADADARGTQRRAPLWVRIASENIFLAQERREAGAAGCEVVGDSGIEPLTPAV